MVQRLGCQVRILRMGGWLSAAGGESVVDRSARRQHDFSLSEACGDRHIVRQSGGLLRVDGAATCCPAGTRKASRTCNMSGGVCDRRCALKANPIYS